jgi:hypothetical protein
VSKRSAEYADRSAAGIWAPPVVLAAEGAFIVNSIVWLVGAVVIVLFVLGYFGLR